jgi:GH25 family lysozyme M1 (1,4-beta-N-acetylmuramidase)
MASTLAGIDVSHWQGSGFSPGRTGKAFAIMKATESTNYVDPLCNQYTSDARGADMKVGWYHFARATGSASGMRAEADWFVKNVKGYLGKGILALDWEVGSLGNVSAAKAFLDRVHDQTGIRPVLYTSGSVVTSYNWGPVADADYGLWVARWADSPGSTGAWDNLALWQYTDALSLQGQRVDGDKFYGSRSTWDAYATAGKAPSPDPDDGDDDGGHVKVPTVEVDGVWGSGTTKQRQALLTNAGWYDGPLDGVVSYQNPYWKDRNPGLGSGWDWDSGYKSKDGSKTIRGDQRRLAKIKGKDGQPLYRGAVDGLAGEDYFRAIQREQQTTVDGVVSRPSKAVKAMQTDGNKGRLS